MNLEQVRDILSQSIIDLEFRGNKYVASAIGSACPEDVWAWLSMEKELRDRWWHVEQDDVVMDVGAGCGSYTLAALACGAALVIAFEPDRNAFFDLWTNLLLNGWTGRCFPVNTLVGSEQSMKGVFYPASHSNRPEGDKEKRMVVTIDELVLSQKLNRLDWIKIDVEGAEVEVLKGAKETLNLFSPTILVEYHPGFVANIDDQVRSFLIPLGYAKEELHMIEGEANGVWGKWTK